MAATVTHQEPFQCIYLKGHRLSARGLSLLICKQVQKLIPPRGAAEGIPSTQAEWNHAMFGSQNLGDKYGDLWVGLKKPSGVASG